MDATVKIIVTFIFVAIGIFIPNRGKTVAVKINEIKKPVKTPTIVSIKDNFLDCISR